VAALSVLLVRFAAVLSSCLSYLSFSLFLFFFFSVLFLSFAFFVDEIGYLNNELVFQVYSPSLSLSLPLWQRPVFVTAKKTMSNDPSGSSSVFLVVFS
jgi:hypothetical protein